MMWRCSQVNLGGFGHRALLAERSPPVHYRQPPPRVKRQLTALPARVLMTAENSPARWPPHLPLPLHSLGAGQQRCKLFRQNGPKPDVVAATTASNQGLVRLRCNCKITLQPDYGTRLPSVVFAVVDQWWRDLHVERAAVGSWKEKVYPRPRRSLHVFLIGCQPTKNTKRLNQKKQRVQQVFFLVLRAFVVQMPDEFKTCKNLSGRLFRLCPFGKPACAWRRGVL